MESKKYPIENKIKYFCFLIIYYFLFPFAKLLYGRKNNWLICERSCEAQDNGFVFYKYLIAEHKEINAVYLIKKDCEQYKYVKDLGKVVQFGSFRHFVMAIGFPVKISSHIFGYAPWTVMVTHFRRNKTFDKHIFLQHGIIKNFHPNLKKKYCKSLSLFVCGAKPEYEYIYNDFEYKNSVPQYTGLPRYDCLIDESDGKQILFMPTWRADLVGLNQEDFKKTDFYYFWNALLNDSKLNKFCLNNKLTIKFYLHAQLKNYISLFKENKVARMVSYDDDTVQSLIKKSYLLVTDFSSVFFDFAYLNKSLIYFQFDEETFNTEHYKKGYFDYRKDGFGKVCNTVNSCVLEIIEIMSSKSNPYSEKSKSFFLFRDSNNCKRVYDIIKKL